MPPALLAGLALALALAGCSGDDGSQDRASPGPVARALGAACATVGLCGSGEARASPDTGGARERVHLVELGEVARGALRVRSVHTGSLRNRLVVRVFNQEEGRVTLLPYFEGDAVRSGDVLLELDSTLLTARLDKAVAVREDAETSLRRVEQLQQGNVISQDEVARALTAVEVARSEERVLRTRLGYTRVLAPFAGVVTARLVEVGDVVPRHSHVLTVADPSSLVTDLMVSELLLPHLEVDDPVEVRIDALGDRTFQGRVLRIHPDLDPRSRQGRVEVVVGPVPAGARAGQFARVSFTTEAPDRKHLQFSALRRDRDGEYVFRVDAELRATRVAVRSGRRLADRVEIVEGLEAGERVVVRGFFGLEDGQVVKPVTEPRAERS